MKSLRCLLIMGLVLLLTGCRVELYSDLSEDDANQMMAILMQHHITADKQSGKEGVTLRVEEEQFINAVELLRLNGFPRRSYVSAATMFPPNQLVVSPAEEQQKILFLNEQRIENMLSQMDGVIHASVTIASGSPDEEGATGPSSVAVFIKYSPQINLEAFRIQIQSLIAKSIPGIRQEQISILMQPAEFRLQPVNNVKEASDIFPFDKQGIQWLMQHRQWVIAGMALAAFLMMILILLLWRKR